MDIEEEGPTQRPGRASAPGGQSSRQNAMGASQTRQGGMMPGDSSQGKLPVPRCFLPNKCPPIGLVVKHVTLQLHQREQITANKLYDVRQAFTYDVPDGITGFMDPSASRCELKIDLTPNVCAAEDIANAPTLTPASGSAPAYYSSTRVNYLWTVQDSGKSFLDVYEAYFQVNCAMQRTSNLWLLCRMWEQMNYSWASALQYTAQGGNMTIGNQIQFPPSLTPNNLTSGISNIMCPHPRGSGFGLQASSTNMNYQTVQSIPIYMYNLCQNAGVHDPFVQSNPGASFVGAPGWRNTQYPIGDSSTILTDGIPTTSSTPSTLSGDGIGFSPGAGGFGFAAPMSQNFSCWNKAAFSVMPIFWVIQDGATKCVSVLQRTFRFLQPDNLFGGLSTLPDNKKLLPVMAARDMMFRFRFNPYALQCSNPGPLSSTVVTSSGGTVPPNRAYCIQEFNVYWEVWQIKCCETMNLIMDQYTGCNACWITSEAFIPGDIMAVAPNTMGPTIIQIPTINLALQSYHLQWLPGSQLQNYPQCYAGPLMPPIVFVQSNLNGQKYPETALMGRADSNTGFNDCFCFFKACCEAWLKNVNDSSMQLTMENYCVSKKLINYGLVLTIGSSNVDVYGTPGSATQSGTPPVCTQVLTSDWAILLDGYLRGMGQIAQRFGLPPTCLVGGNILTGVNTNEMKVATIQIKYGAVTPPAYDRNIFSWWHVTQFYTIRYDKCANRFIIQTEL